MWNRFIVKLWSGSGKPFTIWPDLQHWIYHFKIRIRRFSVGMDYEDKAPYVVPDPWHVGTDPAPDSRIRTSDWRIRILPSRCQQKNIYILYFFAFTFWRYIYKILHRTDKKPWRKHLIVEKRIFLLYFLLNGGRLRILKNTDPYRGF